MDYEGKVKYDPNSGEFTWLVNSHKNKVGDVCGSINKYGYVCFNVNRKRQRAHRLAWFLFYGWMPDKSLDIDHKNRNKADNSIRNLRLATRSQNSWNCNVNANNASGFRGVCWHKKYNKWVARVHINRKSVFYGQFDSFEAACYAVRMKRKEIYGNFSGADC